MSTKAPIPAFSLYGEDSPFPDVIHIETIAARAPLHDWVIAPHRHRAMAQLFVINKGQVACKIDGARWQLSDHSFLFVPALTVHEFRFQPLTEGSVFSFPSALVGSFGVQGRDVHKALSKPFSGTLTDPTDAVLALLHTVFQSAADFRTEQAVALTGAALSLIAEQADMGSAQGALFDRIRRLDALIVRHGPDGWGASDYATALAVSTGHLSRLCRGATGMGAAAYIEHKLMEEARRLLAFTRLPVSDVGYRLGFGDPSYFSKRFTKVCGQTPSIYRQGFVDL